MSRSLGRRYLCDSFSSAVIRHIQLTAAAFLAAACMAVDADQTARLQSDIELLTTRGSRNVGYPGCALAADLIEERFRSLGLADVRREEYRVGVPMDRGAALTIPESGETIPMLSVWPNLVRTSTLPPDGLRLPLIYGGSGEWSELNGHQLEGRAVLMEFNSELKWMRPAALGAAAFVFIEPDHTTIREAHGKYAVAPLDAPRFWIDRESGDRLRRRLAQDGGELAIELRGRMDWEMMPSWNLLASLPGADPELAEETVVIQAYYDASSVVPGLAPGAIATCGISALMEIARHFSEHPPDRTVLFLATSAHYQAQQGMADFVTRHARTHEEYSARFGDPIDISLFIGLDLSSGSDQLGVSNNTRRDGLRRHFVPYARVFMAHGEAAAKALGRDPLRALVNGISPIRGMDWDSLTPGGIVADANWALASGLPALTLATVYDRRQTEFTPLDREVDIGNLDRQVAMLKRVLRGALNDTTLSSGRAALVKVLKDQLRDLTVTAMQFPRRSQAPDRPVEGAVVVASADDKQRTGVHLQRVAIADEGGAARFPGVFIWHWDAFAYELDAATGAIIQAPDLSKRAEVHHGKPMLNGALQADVRWDENSITIVLFKTRAEEIYALISPRSLETLGVGGILDPAGAAPREFGFSFSKYESEPAGVVFGPALASDENRLKIIFGGLLGQRILLLNSQGARQ